MDFSSIVTIFCDYFYKEVNCQNFGSGIFLLHSQLLIREIKILFELKVIRVFAQIYAHFMSFLEGIFFLPPMFIYLYPNIHYLDKFFGT